MKDYIGQVKDLTGDTYLNPAWPENNRPVGNIKKIVVHHDAVIRPHDYDSVARYKSEAKDHYARLGPGLQYHFKIDNTGTIFKIRPFNITTWHCGDLAVNKTSLAICVDGNFEEQVPTKEQYEALKQLLDNLCTQHPEFPADQNDVFGHREIHATACPGKNLIDFVVNYRNNNGNIDIPNVAYDWPSLQPQDSTPPTDTTPQPSELDIVKTALNQCNTDLSGIKSQLDDKTSLASSLQVKVDNLNKNINEENIQNDALKGVNVKLTQEKVDLLKKIDDLDAESSSVDSVDSLSAWELIGRGVSKLFKKENK